MVSFLFNAGEGYRMVDAAARAHELDEELWPQLVTKSAALDLLPSGAPHVGSEVARGQLSRIIEFARRQYDVICADLSGSFDGPSLEVLREVSQVFLVTTPEVAALHHARLKILALNDINFEGSVSLLLNRATTRAEFSRAEVEKLVGLPVSMEFPCSYAGVNKAIRDAQPVRELIPSCRRFADQVLQKKNPGQKRNRFVQYFALMPMRYGFRRAC